MLISSTEPESPGKQADCLWLCNQHPADAAAAAATGTCDTLLFWLMEKL